MGRASTPRRGSASDLLAIRGGAIASHSLDRSPLAAPTRAPRAARMADAARHVTAKVEELPARYFRTADDAVRYATVVYLVYRP